MVLAASLNINANGNVMQEISAKKIEDTNSRFLSSCFFPFMFLNIKGKKHEDLKIYFQTQRWIKV